MSIQIPHSPMRPMAGWLTRSKLREMELYTWLCDRTGRSHNNTANIVWKSTKDARRLFTAKQRRQIVARDRGCCAYCERQLAPDESGCIDHVVPHALGGQTVNANGVLACSACNLKKSAKIW